ncbi:MAG: hypothetical protein ABIA74_04565 [bacterium]
MNRISKKALLKFNIFVSIVAILFAFQILKHGISTGIQMALLIWSLYILCVPAKHGFVILGFPYRFITKQKMKYPEVYMWVFALLFSLTELFVSPLIFFKSEYTHLLYRILTTPWPYWLIPITSAASSLYPFFVDVDVTIRTKKHFLIRKGLLIVSLITLSYFAFVDFIILLNMHAGG